MSQLLIFPNFLVYEISIQFSIQYSIQFSVQFFDVGIGPQGIRSQSAAHPRLPSSTPARPPPPSLPPSPRANRRRVGAAQLLRIFLALSSFFSSLRSPNPICPPVPSHLIPNSQCFSLHCPLFSQEDYVPTHPILNGRIRAQDGAAVEEEEEGN